MSEENKIETHECLCQKKGFRKFLIVAGGTFVGAFLALSLFATLNKPPMPMPCPCPCAGQQMMGHQFDRRPNFHKKHIKDHAPMPPRAAKPAPELDD